MEYPNISKNTQKSIKPMASPVAMNSFEFSNLPNISNVESLLRCIEQPDEDPNDLVKCLFDLDKNNNVDLYIIKYLKVKLSG